LGKIAYSVYLFHLVVVGATYYFVLRDTPTLSSLADLGVAVTAIVLTLALGTASWYFFERHFIALGGKLQYESNRSNLRSSVAQQAST
jgi:peptidoglycan/LPS O-acetylase OafA/YrhL